VTTGDAGDNAITITTGSASTQVTANGAGDTITVNATQLAQASTLTLIGSAAFVVTGLVGDLDASALTGTLTVTAGDAGDNAITITTGSASTQITANGAGDTITVDAAALADDINVTLTGSAAFVVTGLVGNLDASALTGTLTVTTGDAPDGDISIATGSGSNIINASALTAGDTLTLTGNGAATVTLDGADLSAGTYAGNITVTAGDTSNMIVTGSGADIIDAGGGADNITAGAGADTITGGAGADTFVVSSGESIAVVGGSGDSGTISGYDVVTDFDVTEDVLDLEGTVVAAADTAGTDGNNSNLTIGGQTVKSHSISNGVITFDDDDSYSSALTLNSAADVAAVVEYLQQNDLGDAGTTVSFVAIIGGVQHTLVYEQVADDPGSDDILVALTGVTVSDLFTLINDGHVA
jgi:Ca2+-binding RTX toxin-like protein